MWKAIIAAAVLLAGTAAAQAPPPAAVRPYVEALAAAALFLPGGSAKTLSLVNYDDASHRALQRAAFTAAVLGGGIAPTAHLDARGSLLPTAASWHERRYLLSAEQRCAVQVNVGDVEAGLAAAVPFHAAFSVWHELAHCQLQELLSAGGVDDLPAQLAAALPPAHSDLVYSVFSESYADSLALLVQAAWRGNGAAREMAAGAQRFRHEEQGGHDTGVALGHLLQLLDRYDLSALTPRDRAVLAMNLAVEATVDWAQVRAGASLRALLQTLEGRLLPAIAAAAAAPRTAAALPAYLVFPAPGQPPRIALEQD